MALPDNFVSDIEGVANLAVAKLGQAKRFTDLSSDTHPYVKQVNVFLYQVIREVESEFRWNELTRTTVLATPAGQEADGGWYYYALPDDYLRPASNRENGVNYRVENGYLYTPQSTNFELKYIRYSEDPSEWSGLLLKCVYFRLALEICMPLTENANRYNALLEEYEKVVFPRAKRTASFDNEYPRGRRVRGTFSRTRAGYGRTVSPVFRDLDGV